MIKQTMNTSEVVSQLMSDEYADWSYEGATALAEWYEELSEGMGEDIEFDRVAIRCDWNELSPEETVWNYGHIVSRDLPSDPSWAANCGWFMVEFVEELQDWTSVIVLDNGNILVMEFQCPPKRFKQTTKKQRK